MVSIFKLALDSRRSRLGAHWLLGLTLALLSVSCGDSAALDVSGQTVAAPTSPTTQRLRGVWGGYFPGSSYLNPEQGLEIHFDRQKHQGLVHGAAFVHRANWQAFRHSVDANEFGDSVVLTFDPGSSEEATFQGTFVNPNLVRGTFRHQRRGESYEMDLVAADSAPLETLKPLSLAGQEASVNAQAAASYLTLQLEFDAVSETIPDGSRHHRLLYGYGIKSEGRWLDREPGAPLGFDDKADTYGGGRGITDMAQMNFFPDWVYLDAFPPLDAEWFDSPVFSIELPWWALLTLDGSKLAGKNYAAQTYFDFRSASTKYVYAEVKNLKLSYVETPQRLDAPEIAVTVQNADRLDVPYSPGIFSTDVEVARQVPRNTRTILERLGFGSLEPTPNPGLN
jgi:hypothetical protein